MKISKLETGIGAVQWFIFLLANCLTIPIIVGQLFQLSPEDISGLMQRTFFIVGLSSLLSGYFGHRLPISDGPAGIWLAVFTLMGQVAMIEGITNLSNSLQLLEGSMLLAGIILLIVSITGWMEKLLSYFTPLVNGVYLTILGFQLCGIFLEGMFDVKPTSISIEMGVVLLSFSTFLLVLYLGVWGKGWLKSYAVLIGIVIGSIFFVIFYGSHPFPKKDAIFSLPEVFAWGTPKIDGSMIVSAILVAIVLILSIIASIAAMKHVLSMQSANGTRKEGTLKSSGLISGVNTILSAVFSVVGVVPYTVTASFVQLTGQKRMKPYFIASFLLAFIAFFPAIYSFFAMLPGPIANGAMLASYTTMAGIGISTVLKEPLDQRRLTILSISLSLGIGVMFLPEVVISAFPGVLQYVISNGVMVGLLTALIFEHVWKTSEV
ncbi:purine/pyrimidine permease [Ureibacillus endophyticus]|uniref:Xanthine permease n=1 Tax=Ureibacillus endophyticus TaxID=1978490 RepID=A0A494Z744_9BACL|nr:purine/pyrimidine permease [Lysinibacillus endophyticus]RKQ18429.1 xanthine permease [Lysinibacillus endophyticus]